MTVLKADPNTRNLLGREGLQERDSHGRNYRRQPGREILRVLTESQTVKNSGGGGRLSHKENALSVHKGRRPARRGLHQATRAVCLAPGTPLRHFQG